MTVALVVAALIAARELVRRLEGRATPVPVPVRVRRDR